MKTLTVTRADILSWEPCADYPERLPGLLPGRANKRWSALAIIEAGKVGMVPTEDVFWVVLRPELISEHDLYELACRCASRALREERKAGREPDPRSWAAIETRRAWLRGDMSDEDLSAAESVARSAAWSAVRSAAESAARSAAWSWQLACIVRLLKTRGYE